jgi:hypothetical protein
MAPEVGALRSFRDEIVRSTPWGKAFFDEWWAYYYSFSPEIVDRLERDERFAQLLRSVHIAPMLIALRLFSELPSDPDHPGEATRFARSAIEHFGDWIRDLPFEAASPSSDPEALTAELAAAVRILPTPHLRAPGFEALRRARVLPIDPPEDRRAACKRVLAGAGLTPDEIAACMAPGADDA